MSLSSHDVLPDCRTREAKNLRNRGGMFWAPIFCANCGAPGGSVPEENMNFAFYLCMPCGDKYGDVAGLMKMPDEVFWAEVAAEQEEKHRRALSAAELMAVVEADASPLATLIKQGRV